MRAALLRMGYEEWQGYACECLARADGRACFEWLVVMVVVGCLFGGVVDGGNGVGGVVGLVAWLFGCLVAWLVGGGSIRHKSILYKVNIPLAAYC
jgi:hypothetical protein